MTAREVELTGGAPWGFRMHGGADQNQPLRISRCYSDILQRTLDVNPGRKASLSGIREGDVISSINGRATKGMSNSDAHAMLRSAGPVMRLGLNEDREMSPRRRSIGKSSELKRPSQLIAEIQSEKATPQAPVYATIRSPLSPQHRPSSSSARGSLTSLPGALNSIPLVKSVVQNEEPLKFHPTNPFFTTLPSNSNTSKLPVPNGRSSLFNLDRNKVKDSSYRDSNSDLSPIFSKPPDSEHSSLPYYHGEAENNGYDSYAATPIKEKSVNFSSNNNQDQFQNQRNKNPFDTKRNSDPFEKYLRGDSKLNGQCEYDSKPMPSSISDNNFQSNEVITKRSTITEHSINEVEDVKTVKKIILNGCNPNLNNQNAHTLNYEENQSDGQTPHFTKSNSSLSHRLPRSERLLSTPIHERNDYFNTFHQDERDRSSTRTYEPVYKESRTIETQASEVVSKPPVISPRTPAAATAPSPIPKRE